MACWWHVDFKVCDLNQIKKSRIVLKVQIETYSPIACIHELGHSNWSNRCARTFGIHLRWQQSALRFWNQLYGGSAHWLIRRS